MNDSKRKCVLLIIDGLGDLPVAALDGNTPLESATTPVLNHLAQAGQYGLVDPVAPGEVPNTHSGCGVLLGLLPEHTRGLKRGPVEAAGAGRKLKPGEIALRANFATLQNHPDGLFIADRRAGRISSGTDELASVVNGADLGDGVSVVVQPTDQHRCVLILSGPGLAEDVTDTDPGDAKMPSCVQQCSALTPGAEKTAEKINEFVHQAHRRLEGHPVNSRRSAGGDLPANGLITRGAGAAIDLHNVVRERGVRQAMVAGCNTVRGLADILGFEVIFDPRFTADQDTDLEAKMTAAVQALDQNDLVYVHVKAPDIFSHDRQPMAKRDFLTRLDQAIDTLLHAGVMIVLTADHTTDSNSGAHTADPVPTLLYDPENNPGSGKSRVNFGESACRNGDLPRQRGHEILIHLLERMGY